MKGFRKRLAENRKKVANSPFDYLSGLERQVLHRISQSGIESERLYNDVSRIIDSREEYESIIKLFEELQIVKRDGERLVLDVTMYERKDGCIGYRIKDPLTGEKYPDFLINTQTPPKDKKLVLERK